MESRKAVLEFCLVSESLDYDTAALRLMCTIRWQPFSVVTVCSLQPSPRRIAHFIILQGDMCKLNRAHSQRNTGCQLTGLVKH